MQVEKYFIFEQNGKRFALDIKCVHRVTQSVYVEPFVEKYEHLQGVVNYQGKIIPVLDVGSVLFGNPEEININDHFVIIFLNNHYFILHIQNSLGIEDCKILDETNLDESVEDFELLKGVVGFENEVVPVIDISLLFENHKIKHISQAISK